jgi:uncharacterized protein (DUF1501 family)
MTNIHLPRRRLLQLGASTFAATLFSQLFGEGEAAAVTPVTPKTAGPARSLIVLWMAGGPSHLDTFDPKPGTATGGPFKAIKTKAKGISISEHLPMLAEQAHHLAFLRGMSTKEGNHVRARYLMHTGYAPNPTVIHPSLGSWITEEIGDKKAELPDFVSINGPSVGAGFLGVASGPFFVRKAGAPPDNARFAGNVTDARFEARHAALQAMEASFEAQTGDAMVHGRRSVLEQTVRMMRSPKLARFSIDDEPEALKKAYGDTDFGRGCMLARRLVESGTRVVEVVLDGWDTHKNNFDAVKAKSQALDPGFATLLKDLESRKLLDSTMVVWMGDFGRTPKINGNEGRDHYPQAWSAVVGGGGLRGGIAIGETDAEGAKVVKDKTSPNDLMATLVTRMGIDPAKSFTTPLGRPISITDGGTPIKGLVG